MHEYTFVNLNKLFKNIITCSNCQIKFFKEDTISRKEEVLLNQYYHDHHKQLTSIPDTITPGLLWINFGNYCNYAKFNQEYQVIGVAGVFCNDDIVLIDHPIADTIEDWYQLLQKCIPDRNEKRIVNLIIGVSHPFRKELYNLDVKLKHSRLIKIL